MGRGLYHRVSGRVHSPQKKIAAQGPAGPTGTSQRRHRSVARSAHLPATMRALALTAFLVFAAACLDRDAGRPSEVAAAALRAQCAYRAGAKAEDTLGRELPTRDRIPVDTIVYMIMENRSFDSYLSELPSVGMHDVD